MTPIASRMTFNHELASAKLTHARGAVYALSNLWSHSRGLGDARGLMEKICKYADERGITLILIAQAYGHFDHKALDNDQLVEFYKKFGFEIDPGSQKPYTMTRTPIRKPISKDIS